MRSIIHLLVLLLCLTTTVQAREQQVAVGSGETSADVEGKESEPPARRRICVLGKRTDGRPGSGTRADPFDAGTAEQVDAILRPLYLGGASNLEIVFRASKTAYETYGFGDSVGNVTRGTYGWGIGGSHWTVRLRGATLKLVAKPGAPPVKQRQTIAPAGYFAESSVLGGTIDCNWLELKAAQPDLEAASGICLSGEGARILDTRVVNHGATFVDAGAALALAANHVQMRGAIIARVRVEQCHGAGPIGLILWFNRHHDPAAFGAPQVLDSYFDLGGAGHAVNFFGLNGAEIRGCQFRRAGMAIFSDTASDDRLSVRDNVFRECGWAVYCAGGRTPFLRGAKFSHNDIELAQGAGAIYLGGQVLDCRVSSNHLTFNSSTLRSFSPARGAAITFAGEAAKAKSGNRMEKNIVSAGLTQPVP